MNVEFSKTISTRHGFFSREGGVSEGVFTSLNCSKYVGDDPIKVEKNLEIIKNHFNAKKIILLNQFHSNICIEANNDTPSDVKADGIVTTSKDILIGIYTADCVPALFYDEQKKIIGVAHAGWRGARYGILEATLQKILDLGGDKENIKIALGPSIKAESYIVQKDFISEFETDRFFYFDSGDWHFDVTNYCIDKLMAKGLKRENIDAINTDTFKNHNKYFSYRFAVNNTRGICGRNLSCIML